jgi:hypothetical protein
MMLAVRVSIIFWFTWEKLNINNIADCNQVDITREIRIFYQSIELFSDNTINWIWDNTNNWPEL